MKKPKILKSKKAQIPTTDVFGAAVDSLRSIITWFIQTLPKPLLIILFLLLILLLGNLLIPLIINTLGYHCDSGGTVWKVPFTPLQNNVELITSKPDLENSIYVEVPLICHIIPEALVQCTNCTYNSTAFFLPDRCITDGYRNSNYTSFADKTTCIELGCAPLEGYFYNLTEDKFQCYTDSCVNLTLKEYDMKIYTSKNARIVYKNERNTFLAENLIYLKCNEKNKVNIRLTFWGIDVFDYRLWLLLFVLSSMVWFYLKFVK